MISLSEFRRDSQQSLNASVKKDADKDASKPYLDVKDRKHYSRDVKSRLADARSELARSRAVKNEPSVAESSAKAPIIKTGLGESIKASLKRLVAKEL